MPPTARRPSSGKTGRPLAAALLLLGLGAPGAPAQEAFQAQILSVSEFFSRISIPLGPPFEKALREIPGARVRRIETVPAEFDGQAYRYDWPGGEVEAARAVPALETPLATFLLSADVPSLFEAVERHALDPEAYRRPVKPPVERCQAGYESVPSRRLLRLEPPCAQGLKPHRTMAMVYEIELEGRTLHAVFLGKSLGGFGRLASALNALRAEGPPALVVGRDILEGWQVLQNGHSWPEVFARLGLQVSGVGTGELKFFEQVRRHLEESPRGPRFVCANLVLSSAPAVSALPPYAVLETGGLRVAFLGLTRPSYERYLGRGALKGLSLIDPVQAALRHVKELRARSDVVVALSNLSESDHARLRDTVRGIDLIIGETPYFLPEGPERRDSFFPRRGPFDNAPPPVQEWGGSLTRLSLGLGSADFQGRRSWHIRQESVPLDGLYPVSEGFPEVALDSFNTASAQALIPSVQRLFPEGAPGAPGRFPVLTDRHFWSLAGALAAERTGSEAALLPVSPLLVRMAGDIPEGQIRQWFIWDDELATFELSGADLLSLIAEARTQARWEAQDLPPSDRLRLAASGLGEEGSVHGVPIDPALHYKVAGSQLLLANAQAYPALGRARNVRPLGDLREEILASLRRAAREGWPPERYRRLAEGGAVRETGLWKINFRDVSLNANNTKVLNGPDFSRVPNSRVQGFDQVLLGGISKIDADYLFGEHRWTNTAEIEYSRSRLRPPGLPHVINTPSNRYMAQTLLTRRVGDFPLPWLAHGFGPSLGLVAEGQLATTPGLKRRQVYALNPGLEIFDGTLVQKIELGASVKRDMGRDVPNTQHGARCRVLASTPLPRLGEAKWQGEFWANYYLLSRRDSDQDLRLEGNAVLKLHLPVYKHLSLSPFLDFYFFQLKVRPASGYSFITGVSLGFSRLWKPQYEVF